MADEVQQLVNGNPTARGLVLIVTNDYTDSSDENLKKRPLPACHIDGEKMRKTFSEPELNFALLPTKKNRPAGEIKGLIQQVAKCNFPKSNSYKYFIFVYSGHGSANNCIVANDGGKVDIQHDVVDPLEPGNTSHAVGKIEKLFFFNCCRGKLNMNRPVPLDAGIQRGNYIIAYATMKEYVAYEHETGSEWMVPLAKRLREDKVKAVQLILSDMIKQVKSSPNFLDKYQNPETKDTCGPVYLYPGDHSLGPPAPPASQFNDSAPQPLTKTPDSVAARISGGNNAAIAAGEKSMAGVTGSNVVAGNWTVTNNNYYGQSPVQLQGACAAAPPNTTPSQPLGGSAANTTPSQPLGGSAAGLPKADANTILLKLQEHGFLKHNWMDLAIGLSMGGELGKYEAMRNDTVRLSNMVTDWTNGVEEQERWMTILTALKSSGYGIVARNLAKDLGIDFPN